MSRSALLTVLGRAAVEPAFLDELKANPEAAAKTAGVSLTSEEVTQLKNINFKGLHEFSQQVELKRLAAIVDKKDA